MKECVVVLGMHRSGTSVLTGLISFFGGYIGSDLMPSSPDNPKGYFENNKIYRLNEKILKEFGASWDDYSFKIESVDLGNIEKYVKEAKAIIQDELKYVNKLLIKDPRLCILFPIWERALIELDIDIKIVFTYRSPVEVSHSLLSRDEIDIEKGLMIWSHYFLQSELHSRKYQRLMVEYDKDFQNLHELISRLGEFLGQNPTDEILQKSADFYSFKLKHHQVPLESIADDLPSYLISIKEFLLKKNLDDQTALDLIREEFYKNINYYRFDDSTRALEAQNLNNIQLKLVKLEETYQLLKAQKQKEYEALTHVQEKLTQKHKDDFETLKNEKLQEHQSFLLIQKNLDSEIKNSHSELKKLREKQRKYDELVFDKEELIKQVKISKNTINIKQHQIDLIKSRYASANKLFNRIFKEPSVFKKLYDQSLDSSSLKLKQFLTPFDKNKHLTRNKILIIDSGLFCPFYYLTVHPDIQNIDADPLDYFCTKGWKEGHSPSINFDLKAYLIRYPDVERAQINPLIHYIQHGMKEGRIIEPILHYDESFNVDLLNQ